MTRAERLRMLARLARLRAEADLARLAHAEAAVQREAARRAAARTDLLVLIGPDALSSASGVWAAARLQDAASARLDHAAAAFSEAEDVREYDLRMAARSHAVADITRRLSLEAAKLERGKRRSGT